MSTYFIEGARPLEGSIKPSGSKDSAVKLIAAALLSNEDIVLENVPHTTDIHIMIEIIKSIGGSVSWIGDNKLSVNGSTVNNHIVPNELGAQTRFSHLLAGPLLFRFGKCVLSKTINTQTRIQPINRWIDTWKEMGVEVDSDKEYIYLKAKDLKSGDFNFKINTHMGTANALIMASFIPGQTFITNAAEENELDDLIEFLNTIGGEAERVEPRKIKVIGRNVFTAGFFEVQPDTIETIAYVAAAIVTKGNITIRGLKKLQLASFVNFLTKLGARFEYNRDELCVWYGGEEFKAIRVESAPAPGFLADWLPFATLIMSYAEGTSYVNDTIYVDRYGFAKDLNRMGANIHLKKPSEIDFNCVISDESYDYANLGEPMSSAEIEGVKKLKGTRLNMNDNRFDSVLVIAALGAEGKSELIGIDEMFVRYENFFEKLSSLGAAITSE